MDRHNLHNVWINAKGLFGFIVPIGWGSKFLKYVVECGAWPHTRRVDQGTDLLHISQDLLPAHIIGKGMVPAGFPERPSYGMISRQGGNGREALTQVVDDVYGAAQRW